MAHSGAEISEEAMRHAMADIAHHGIGSRERQLVVRNCKRTCQASGGRLQLKQGMANIYVELQRLSNGKGDTNKKIMLESLGTWSHVSTKDVDLKRSFWVIEKRLFNIAREVLQVPGQVGRY